VNALADQPVGQRINIFLARLCFRGIYFPLMGRLAWLKVIAENRRTIFKLVKQSLFGKARLRRIPQREIPDPDAVRGEFPGELSA
jgi:hypothetical protein